MTAMQVSLLGMDRRRYRLLADEDLISLAESGDAEAFATLYDRHSRAAFSLAYLMITGRQAAEDLEQDAFLKVWRATTSYRADRGSVRTWILSIGHNRGIDQIRFHASRRRMQDKVESSAPKYEPSEAFSETCKNSRRDQVREALNTPRKSSYRYWSWRTSPSTSTWR
jgi:RNA polymerase sigma-70 factor (ECF subfamily)